MTHLNQPTPGATGAGGTASNGGTEHPYPTPTCATCQVLRKRQVCYG